MAACAPKDAVTTGRLGTSLASKFIRKVDSTHEHQDQESSSHALEHENLSILKKL